MVHGNLQAYWFWDGYLRTSSKEFTLKNCSRMVHLTNDAVQKYSDEYGKYESGNKLSYADFQRYIDKTKDMPQFNLVKDIVPKMKKIAQKGVQSVFKKLCPKRRENQFEIFGLDFMIDEDLKPYLIEMNTNPCLELSCSFLARIIPTMIESAIWVAVDPYFPFPNFPKSKKHTIPDPNDCLFELIFNERCDSYEFKTLPGNEAMIDMIAEDLEEDQVSDSEDEWEVD